MMVGSRPREQTCMRYTRGGARLLVVRHALAVEVQHRVVRLCMVAHVPQRRALERRLVDGRAEHVELGAEGCQQLRCGVHLSEAGFMGTGQGLLQKQYHLSPPIDALRSPPIRPSGHRPNTDDVYASEATDMGRHSHCVSSRPAS